jgi:predicted permease
MALGGSRIAIVRQLLMESVLLAVGGGVIGVGLGGFALDWLKQMGADKHQLWRPIELDARVMGAMMAMALFTSVLFGLVPALSTTRLDIRSVLLEGGRGNSGPRRRWSRQALVAMEIALSLVLLVGAGLMVRTLSYLNRLNPGFDTRNVLAAEASLQDARYAELPAVEHLYRESLTRIQGIPGVVSAAVALTLPYERPLNNGVRVVDGDRPDAAPTIELVYATASYFDTLRIPLVAGRGLLETDTPKSAGVVVVSRAFAERYLKGKIAVGHHVSLGGKPREIVGVVGDVQQHSGISGGLGPLAVEPTVYVPVGQLNSLFIQTIHTWYSPKWAIRTSGPAPQLPSQVRAALASVDPLLPIARFRTVEELAGRYTQGERYLAALFSMLAGLALLLASIGLYGLISQTIAQRRHELGIRLALGATVGQTIAGIMRPGLALAGIGVVVGLGLSSVAVRLLKSMVFGVKENDPTTFAAMAGVLLLVAAAASLVPALRILKMDPAETLRKD